MSSILKALKKLEEEQSGLPAKPANRPGGQFIAPGSERHRAMLLLAGGAGIGLAVAVGLFLLLPAPELPVPAQPSKSGIPGSPPVPPVVAANAGPPEVLPAPAVPPKPEAAVAKPVSPPVAPPVAVSVAAQPAPPPPQSAPIATAPIATPIVAAPQPTTGSVPAEPIEQVQVERREIPLPGQQWSAPRLTVSEILPASGGERMAIVNDLPVMEGTQVDNALVEKILADRVRFVIDGKVVEIRPSAGP